MQNYHPPLKASWSGRNSPEQLYLHEKVTLTALSKLTNTKNTLALLGYACDEGVRLNQGRAGAKEGPMSIRKALSKMPNHLKNTTTLIDVGDIVFAKSDLDTVQKELALAVTEL